MAVKQGSERRSGIDPAVTSALGGNEVYGRMARERSMTQGQKRKAALDRERNRVTLDMPDWMEEAVGAIAEELKVPRSRVACWLIAWALTRYDKAAMMRDRQPTRSMRYDWVLELPDGIDAGKEE